jgi:hypothetical protein
MPRKRGIVEARQQEALGHGVEASAAPINTVTLN